MINCANYNHNPIDANLNAMVRLSGYAMLSNKNSILQSSNNVNLYLYGAFSCYNTTISCSSGKKCNLECKTSWISIYLQ